MNSFLNPNSKRNFFKTNNDFMNKLIVPKFSFTIFTPNPNICPNIDSIQDKSNIIIIDKQENFYVICFDYNLVLIAENDKEYLKSFLNNDSEIYCFTEDITQKPPDFKISYINKDIIFTNEIKKFDKEFCIEVSQDLPKINEQIKVSQDLPKINEQIKRTIYAFLIKKAYSNSKFDVICHCREIFSQKVTEMLVKKDEFIVIRQLGHKTSDVELIYLIKHEKLCAMKIFIDNNNDLYENELNIYREISHPLIPRLLGTVEGYGYPCIIIDFLDGITLQKINKNKFSVGMKIKFFFEILVIFRYIHSEGYMYVDLKPDNIFIVGYSLIFLFDFDRMIRVPSNDSDKEIYREFGHYYVAPEIEDKKIKKITQKVDIYSIGKIIEFMFFKDKCIGFSQDNSKLIEKIYSQCTNINPESRPNISRLIEIFYDCFFIKISKISEIDTIKSINNINSNESFSFLIFLAEYQNSHAQYFLGEFYEEGKYLVKDINKAIYYFLRSSKQNNINAIEKLKKLFEKVDLNELDGNLKIKYLEFAAKENHPEAQYQLGMIYYENPNLKDSINESIHYLLLSAKQNNKRAREKLKEMFYKIELIKHELNTSLRIQYLQFNANENIPEAQYQLGVLYLEGNCVDQDINRSLNCFLMAASLNHVESIYMLGVLYLEGTHIEKDIETAEYYLSMAAKQNHQEAQKLLDSINSEKSYFCTNQYFKLSNDSKTINNSNRQTNQNNNCNKNKMNEASVYYKLASDKNNNNISSRKKKVESNFVVSYEELVKSTTDQYYTANYEINTMIETFFSFTSSDIEKSTKESFSEQIIFFIENLKKYDEIKEKKNIQLLLDTIINIMKENDSYINDNESVKDKIVQWLLILIREKCFLIESLVSDIEDFIDYLRKFCSKKLYKTAIHYYEGDEGQENVYKSIDYFKSAANYGHVEAQYYLGIIYSEDKIVKRNIDEAIKYFSLASAQNHPEAQYRLGMIYYNGNYVQRNIEKAIYNLLMAADRNHSESQYQLGMIYYENQNLEDSIYKSIHYLLLSAKQNNERSKEKLDEIIEKVHLNELIPSTIEKVSELYYQLGILYLQKNYVYRDIKKSLNFLTLASSQNHVESQYKLGILYFVGKKIQRDIEKAISYLTSAADQNHSRSQHLLGMIYYENQNLKSSYNKSIHYLLLSANQNN